MLSHTQYDSKKTTVYTVLKHIIAIAWSVAVLDIWQPI